MVAALRAEVPEVTVNEALLAGLRTYTCCAPLKAAAAGFAGVRTTPVGVLAYVVPYVIVTKLPVVGPEPV